ncbi:MAG TPA: peptidoglycan recognition family protein [Candidatus Saccharimonadales bacterium]|nr:peptidoglycan recognition family protein [Candidatus Saccharimonadales bacterium]
MALYFDQQAWREALKQPDWYLLVGREYQRFSKQARQNPDQARAIKEEVRSFLEERLRLGEVALATAGPNLDAERQPIDTVVIHHTSGSSGLSLERLNVIHLLNLYLPHFANPHGVEREEIKGQPIWSNHLRDGRQVFWAYHWLVRMNGTAERLLEDDQIGWQAGNWEVNCRSVAICLDNDYTDSVPTSSVIRALAQLVRRDYPHIEPKRVFGHREINPKTMCPGNKFLAGWKAQLIGELA